VLEGYYRDLWRAYVFVSPDTFTEPVKCKRIVDAVCARFKIPPSQAYKKVRRYDWKVDVGDVACDAMGTIGTFLRDLSITDVPQDVLIRFLQEASKDAAYRERVGSDQDGRDRLSSIFAVTAYDTLLTNGDRRELSDTERAALTRMRGAVAKGEAEPRGLAARSAKGDLPITITFSDYLDNLRRAGREQPSDFNERE
jgi:hypothetical protein